MKTIIVCIVLVIIAILSVRAALGRSKIRKCTLWAFDGKDAAGNKRKEDNLGKMTPSALEGLDAAQKKKEQEKNEKAQENE